MKRVEMVDDGMRMKMRDEERDILGLGLSLYTQTRYWLLRLATLLPTMFGQLEA